MELIAKSPVVGFVPGRATAVSGAVFHLIPEAASGGACSDPVEIPGRVSGLRIAAGGSPELVDSDPARLRLEPVLRDGQPRLLLVNLGDATVRHNDRVAPPAVLLRDRDHFRLPRGPAIEVALFNRPFVGRAPADLVGEKCPICRSAFTADSRLFRCAICGSGLHLEQGDPKSVLQCATVATECPVCSQAIALTEGYLSPPDFLTEAQSLSS